MGYIVIDAIRIRGQTCGCGRPFVASDFTITADDMLVLTCGRCHDRPIEIEQRIKRIEMKEGVEL